MKIRGNTVGTTTPRPDWDQTNPNRADYIKNKPDMDKFQEQIEEAEAIAKGRATGYVFDTIDDLDAWLADPTNTANLVLGDNLYIRATDVPDYWWDGEQKQILETQKVDLDGYVKEKEYNGKVIYQGTHGGIVGDAYVAHYTGNQTTVPISTQNNVFTIVCRDASGNFYIGDPTIAYHATNKKYVDAQIVAKSRTKDGLKQVYTDNASDNNNRSSLIVDEHGNIVLEPLNERDGVATDADGNPIKSEISGVNNFVKGRGNKVSAQTDNQGGSVVMGDKNTVTKAMSCTIGYENTNNGQGAAFVCGNNNTVNGFAAHVEGSGNTANGSHSHVEGNSNTAEGSYAHVEGCGNSAGNYGHAEGRENTAGNFGHVEGYNCTTTGAWSHAEGRGTTSGGTGSHSEGNGTEASGNDAHAEGYNTKATGAHSHTEGSGTEASGVASHAGGKSSVASHENAFAHGFNLQTGRNNQAVFGRNNVANAAALFIVGNGGNDTDNWSRANAFTVLDDGNAVLAGRLTESGLQGRELAHYRYKETSPGANDKIPASCNAPGVVGEFVVGVAAGYLYICVGENSWVRVPIATNQNW